MSGKLPAKLPEALSGAELLRGGRDGGNGRFLFLRTPFLSVAVALGKGLGRKPVPYGLVN